MEFSAYRSSRSGHAVVLSCSPAWAGQANCNTALMGAPAEWFGDSKRVGRIAPGFAADLVILEKDRSENVRAFAAVRYTIRDGKVIYKANIKQIALPQK